MKYFSEGFTINIIDNGCARPGVTAGKAAEMCVIAVPSVPKKTAEFSSADEVINSLLDIRLYPYFDNSEKTVVSVI